MTREGMQAGGGIREALVAGAVTMVRAGDALSSFGKSVRELFDEAYRRARASQPPPSGARSGGEAQLPALHEAPRTHEGGAALDRSERTAERKALPLSNEHSRATSGMPRGGPPPKQRSAKRRRSKKHS